MSILVVGSVALDTIKTPSTLKKDILGGSAAHFAVGARIFNPVRLVAVVGKDFPKKHITAFEKRGIDITGLDIREGKTFRWEGEYGADFNNPKTLATHLNVFAEFDPQLPAAYRDSPIVFLANIDPEIQQRVLAQVKNPRIVACDTMNFWIEQKKQALLQLLKKIDIFFLNEGEATLLTGKTNIIKAAKAVAKLGPKIVVIKRGEYGSLLYSDNEFFTVPAFPLESVVDPTGAGDTFASGFLGYLSTCKTINQAALKRAVVYGGVMAAFTVEGFSHNKLKSCTKQDVTNRLKEFKRITQF